MSGRQPRAARRKTAEAAEPSFPDAPPPTEEEIAARKEISDGLARLAAELRQRNLDNAVLLAQQAAAGRGPLVEHFAELGRRFAKTLDVPEPKPKLKVITGGR